MRLEHSRVGETEIAVRVRRNVASPYDDVVEQGDVENFCGIGKFACYFYVAGTRRGISARVVVNEYDAFGVATHGGTQKIAGVKKRACRRSRSDFVVAENAQFYIKANNPATFPVERQCAFFEKLKNIAGSRERFGNFPAIFKSAGKLECGDEVAGAFPGKPGRRKIGNRPAGKAIERAVRAVEQGSGGGKRRRF